MYRPLELNRLDQLGPTNQLSPVMPDDPSPATRLGVVFEVTSLSQLN
jgi:hypothetical protein